MCTPDVVQPLATVRNRSQPSATVRNRLAAQAFTFGGFKRRVASFRVAGVVLCDIPTCFKMCRKAFCVTGAILSHRFQKMRYIFRGRRSTLVTSVVILHGMRNTLDVLYCVFFANRIVATPFKMHFDSRPLLRRTFAKISLFTDPGHQQRAHQRKTKYQTPGALVFGSRTASLLETWLLHVELVSL